MPNDPNLNEEGGSIVDKEELAKTEKEREKKIKDQKEQLEGFNSPLFERLDKIVKALEGTVTNKSSSVVVLTGIRDDLKDVAKAIRENTEVMNSLLTIIVMDKEKSDLSGRTSVTVTTSPKVEPPKVEESPKQQPLPPPQTTSPQSQSKIEETKMLFPEELENMLNFSEKGDFIVIKPRQFLGSEYFAKIASVVRGIGGEYVSAGKESHFRIPIKK